MHVIIVHGGASYKKKEKVYTPLKRSLERGLSILEKGGSAVDAVIEAVKVMEEEEIFNAGRGSVLRIDGSIKLDAAVMDGKTLRAGAVAGIEGFLYPSQLARLVMEKTNHILLVGKEAERFAEFYGFKKENLYTEEKRKLWEKVIKNKKPEEETEKLKKEIMETVGAVALDEKGNLAACTSTGGLFFSLPSRVGDTPLIGCGTYANSYGAASATGIGEDIIRVTMARYCIFMIEQGKKAQEASDLAVKELESKTGSFGGIICLDREGNIGVSKNTKYMPVAFYSSKDKKLEVII